ncbi:MAG: tail protein X [Alphaproteobacteria bacterium]|nr:tail protein X [Alphaproteobacteria bacterium]
MTGTYITRDGDRIDHIGQRVYGTPAVAELLTANPRLAGMVGLSERALILPAGIHIALPLRSTIAPDRASVAGDVAGGAQVRLWD